LLAFAAIFSVAPVLLANKKPPLRPVNLNTASALELQQVPGIGPSTADKILQMRKSYGAFKSVDDLRAIKGIGPKRMEKMRKYITVGRTLPAKKPANTAASKNGAGAPLGAKSPSGQAAKDGTASPPAKNSAAKPAAQSGTAPPKKNPPAKPSAGKSAESNRPCR
jgi:competence ComEA-like helix-hairpin-helix protein